MCGDKSHARFGEGDGETRVMPCALSLLDKPDAAKETHAITQLTIYALALSRRTGVPVKAMKCAWFDERDYFEFYPLPAIYPKRA